MDRSYLVGRKFREFTYTMSTEWIEEFAGCSGETLAYTEVDGRREPVVPETLAGVMIVGICQQRWFDLAEALDASWTKGMIMMGENVYEWCKPLRANYPYRVTNEVVRVESKQGKRGEFNVVTVGVQFLEEDGTPAFTGSVGYVVFD